MTKTQETPPVVAVGDTTGAGVVLPKCDNKTAPGRWYCATHDQHFPHNMAMHVHVAENGPHAIGWTCSVHGLEVP